MTKFMVEYRVTGTVSHSIEAANREEAEKQAQAFSIDSTGLDFSEAMLDLDEVTDVDYYMSELHKVKRDGNLIYTSYVLETDERVEEPVKVPVDE